MEPEAIREAVRLWYEASYRLRSVTPDDNPGLTPHQVAMCDALSRKYQESGVQAPEVAVWCEVAPFLNLEPETGLEALAEYIVCKVCPEKARIDWLARHVNEALCKETNFTLIAGPAFLEGAPWVGLLTAETRQRLGSFLEQQARLQDPEGP